MAAYELARADRTFAFEADELKALDVRRTPAGSYHLLLEGRAYHCRIVEELTADKRVTVVINGRQFTFGVKDRYDLMVKELGYATVSTAATNQVLAPMPGLVLDVLVAEGDAITVGTPLMVLEAMKMENVLKAEGDGIIGRIHVEHGQAVDKRQLLIELA